MRVREADTRVVAGPVSEGWLYSMGPCSPVAEGLISLRKAPRCQRLLMYLVLFLKVCIWRVGLQSDLSGESSL